MRALGVVGGAEWAMVVVEVGVASQLPLLGVRLPARPVPSTHDNRSDVEIRRSAISLPDITSFSREALKPNGVY